MQNDKVHIQDQSKESSLVATLTHETGTISSLEIAELTGKQHSHVMRDIRNMADSINKNNESTSGLVDYSKDYHRGDRTQYKYLSEKTQDAILDFCFGKTSSPYLIKKGCYKDAKGENRVMYLLNKKASLLLASGYDVNLRVKIIDRWESLETGQATPIYQAVQQQTQQPVYSLEEKFKAIELSCKLLRKSAASKARMVNALIAPMGLPTFDFVESEGQFLSATDALSRYPVMYKGKNLAAVTFNKILIENGYLEDVPQPRGKTSLKLLTEKGLKWGKNDDVPEHPGSIIAHYNMKKFPELLKELGLK